MKSERRHDLQHNELLDWLNKTFAFVGPHANTILIGLIVILGVVAGMKIWSYRSGQTSEKAWNSLYAAMGSEGLAGLDKVSDDYSNNEVGDWARLISADLRFAAGCEQLFTNKIEAGQELQKAMENYVTVLEMSNQSAVKERATFGLARTYEAMAGTRQSQGELAKAGEKYQEVVDKWPEGVYAKSAQRRLKDLSRESTKKFYDKFAAYDPKPSFDPGVGDLPFDPSSLSPGSAPRDFTELLDSPGLGGGGAAKDESMEAKDQPEGEKTAPEKASDTPELQPPPKQPEKAADPAPAEMPELSPPAAKAPELSPPAAEKPESPPPAAKAPAKTGKE